MKASPGLVVAAFCLGGITAAAAEAPWLEARSAHFRVVTDDGEKSARRVATQFERIRGVFQEQWKWARVDGGEPVVILAVKDEKRMKALLPALWERKSGIRPVGFFLPGPDKHSLILRLDVQGDDNPYDILHHEYTHRVLSLNFASMPLWLNEGLAEFYGSTRIEGDDLQLFEKGCAGGEMPSCTQLGSAYLFGRGVAKDPAKARLLLTKACAANDATACEAARLLSR